MSIKNPTQFVEEFKKSGHYDHLRKELLKEFRQSDAMTALLSRVDDIAKEKLASDPKLQYMPEASVVREVMQELDRYPLVDRAVKDRSLLDDPSFVAGLRSTMRKILQEDRKAAGKTLDGTVNLNGTSHTPGQGGSTIPWKTGGVGVTGQHPAGHADSDSEGSEESMDMDIEEYSSD
ncbi:hypothetical protein BD309DRAFT_1081614 [Dichomitus squalens]|uniref:BOD1/SHG1 domain-containing protein n=1 Tax=Dichomitus squalens TaxID=114155 RepID=A0A4Q9MZC4_9APHY|nr:hypothetical protein BD311DRAFT_655255 [Dichomitus squalens]TBU42144.1 hypothetical protein BD309DRAFT_1081614 [Dichomitus squalens]TBU61362.1 hypothetical protein BD310DRAFT_873989 [Dichomitus squalens]